MSPLASLLHNVGFTHTEIFSNPAKRKTCERKKVARTFSKRVEPDAINFLKQVKFCAEGRQTNLDSRAPDELCSCACVLARQVSAVDDQ
jgi:hypothetical protein